MIRPTLLLILDGWGHAAPSPYNAIHLAHTPNWDSLWQKCPHALLTASGSKVGLPSNQIGNSEVGHLVMGSGRIPNQYLSRINNAITNNDLITNPFLTREFTILKKTSKSLHLIGLLSDGGIHSHQEHLHALLSLSKDKGMTDIKLHLILDGRDTPPKSAELFIKSLITKCQQLGVGEIVTIMGRFFAMDRDNRWERTEKAHRAIVYGQAEFSTTDALLALKEAYLRGETDEFITPTVIKNSNKATNIEDGDSIFFTNFRADRARQLCSTFATLKKPKLNNLITMTRYADDLVAKEIFPVEILKNSLGECVSKAKLKQLRIAETEKYAHVTYFFNGGIEQSFINETRLMIPSPQILKYDDCPAMKTFEITDSCVKTIINREQDFIVVNFANADMVGHTGNLAATIQAINSIDLCLGKIIAAIKEVNGQAIITADHGNAEYMYDHSNKQPHTAHTSSMVPFLLITNKPNLQLRDSGTLEDVAPTVLFLMELDVPGEMTGNNLVC